jgi:hypothetical protein
MRSLQSVGSAHAHRARTSPACLASPRSTGAGGSSFAPSLTPSTFLRPLAPRPLRRFVATMDALTPGRVSTPAQVSLIHAHILRFVPPPTTPRRPRPALTRYPSADGLPVAGSGLRRSLAGSPRRQAESRSSSCGPNFHLLLLPTPPRGDAVAVGYGPESVCPEGTSTLQDVCALRRTSAAAAPPLSIA